MHALTSVGADFTLRGDTQLTSANTAGLQTIGHDTSIDTTVALTPLTMSGLSAVTHNADFLNNPQLATTVTLMGADVSPATVAEPVLRGPGPRGGWRR